MDNRSLKLAITTVQKYGSAVIIEILIAVTGFFGINTKMTQCELDICARAR